MTEKLRAVTLPTFFSNRFDDRSGMIVGSATIFVVKNYIAIEGEYFYELLPGFILAFVAVVGVSLLTPMPSEETLRSFTEAGDAVRGI